MAKEKQNVEPYWGEKLLESYALATDAPTAERRMIMPTCNICKYAGRPIYKSPCSECKGFSKYEYEKIQTNADRIRSMSDEELAKHLVDIGWDCHFCTEHCQLDNEPLMRCEKCDKKCAEHCLKWLQQPAEEDNND